MILFIKDVPCFRSFFVISCHVKSNWCLRPIITSLMVQSSLHHGVSWWCTLCGTWSAPPGSSQTEKLIGHISFHSDLWLCKFLHTWLLSLAVCYRWPRESLREILFITRHCVYAKTPTSTVHRAEMPNLSHHATRLQKYKLRQVACVWQKS